MRGKEIVIGFIFGIVATIIGMFFYITADFETGFFETIKLSFKNDTLGGIIGIGALLNFLPFFVFLKKGQALRSRGVLIASILIALIIAIIKVYNNF